MRLGQRRLSSRWNRRRASRRAASRSFNAPQSNPDGRTVCPSSPAARSHGACPCRCAIARHSSTTTAVSSNCQVLDLVDDDAVEVGEPFRQFAVPQPTDGRRRGGQLGKGADHRVGSDVLGHLEQRARRRPPDAVVARTPVAVRGVAQPYQPAGRDRIRVPGHSAAEQHRPYLGMQRRVAVSPRAGLPASEPRGGRGEQGAALRQCAALDVGTAHLPRNVAKSRASTRTSAGANALKCSSAAAVSSRDHVRCSTRWPLRASTAFHNTVVFPDPGPSVHQAHRAFVPYELQLVRRPVAADQVGVLDLVLRERQVVVESPGVESPVVVMMADRAHEDTAAAGERDAAGGPAPLYRPPQVVRSILAR